MHSLKQEISRILPDGCKWKTEPCGFALVISLGLMAFVTLVLILITAQLRIKTSEAHLGVLAVEARNNSLLAATMALSQLQKNLGPDTRATSVIHDPTGIDPSGNWTAAWDTGNPDNEPLYLISHSQNTDLFEVSTDEMVLVFGSSSSTPDENRVFAPTIPFVESDNSGPKMAWWIGDESVKAKVNVPILATGWSGTNSETEAQLEKSIPSTTGLPALGDLSRSMEDDPINKERNAKIINSDTLALFYLENGLPATAAEQHYHTVSTHSLGLLTNPVLGGLKKDLTLAFEMSDTLFSGSEFSNEWANAPAGQDQTVGFVFEEPTSTVADATIRGPTWSLLRNFYKLYQKDFTSRSTPSLPIQAHKPNTPEYGTYYEIPLTKVLEGRHGLRDGDNFINQRVTLGNEERDMAYLTEQQIAPVIQRLILILTMARDEDDLINLVAKPVLVLWNPYNVAVEFDRIIMMPFNLNLNIRISGTDARTDEAFSAEALIGLNMALNAASGRDGLSTGFGTWLIKSGPGREFSQVIRMQPGENRIFSLAGNQPELYVDDSLVSILNEGWNANGGIAMRKFINSDDRHVDLDDNVLALAINESAAVNAENFFGAEPVAGRFQVDEVLVPEDLLVEIIPTNPNAVNYSIHVWHAPRGEGIDNHNRRNELDMLYSLAASLNMETDNVDLPPSYFPFPEGDFMAAMGGTWRERPIFKFDHFRKTISEQQRPISPLGTINPRGLWNWRKLDNGQFSHFDFAGMGSTLTVPASLNFTDFETTADGLLSFWGTSMNADTGSTHVSTFEVPLTPMLSLAQFSQLDVFPSPYLPAQLVGNSRAPALIPSNRREASINPAGNLGAYTYPDVSLIMNEVLFDNYFFSAIVPRYDYAGGTVSVVSDIPSVIEAFANDPVNRLSMHPRMQPLPSDDDSLEDSLLTDDNQISPEAYTRSAAFLGIDGAFNVNSTNEMAWRVLLHSLRNRSIAYIDSMGVIDTTNDDADSELFGIFWSRLSLPQSTNDDLWRTWSTLSETEIDDLAEAIVTQIRQRGPFMNLADFINREVGTGPNSSSGSLQAAIDAASSINDPVINGVGGLDEIVRGGLANGDGLHGKTVSGISSFFTQADLLKALAPLLTTRGDTFVIRAYGSSDTSGNSSKEALCEIVVQRIPEFVQADANNRPWTSIDNLAPINQMAGRKFVVTSFRWLSSEEI